MPSSRTSRRLRHLGIVLFLGAFVGLCWPKPDSLRAEVSAEIARRLGKHSNLVELEWLETRPSGSAVTFEAFALVSDSQPGDLHASRYRATGTCSTDKQGFQLQQMRLTQLPSAPPEARP